MIIEYLNVNSLQPLFIWHFYVKYDIEIAFLIWSSVYWHTLPFQHNGILRLDNFACWSGHFDASTVEVGKDNP